MENHRTASTPCPYCRKNFKLNQLKTNLLANAMINELEIYCSNRVLKCPWKGEMQRIAAHLKICAYGKDQIPAWLAEHQLSLEREEEAIELMDDDIRDKQLQEQTKPLAMRLF